MTLTLNVTQVLDLAEQAVNIRGREHVQSTCKYLTVTETDDGLVYKAECFVGMILFLLVGAQRFIKAALPVHASGTYMATDGVNGACDSMAFDELLERMDVTITPQARNLLNLMQKAQDGGLPYLNNQEWGTALSYASGVVETFRLRSQEEDAEALAKSVDVNAAIDHEARVQYVRNNDVVMQKITNEQIIHAIKDVRTALKCGLKEAKDAVDAVRFNH